MKSTTRQERSRETEAKLIAAALRLLRQGGLEGFTVPALAAEAGLAVGTLYRRFTDKASLLQHVFEAMAAGSEACAEPTLVAPATVTLPEFVEAMVSQLMAGYRADGRILHALQQFARTHPDPEFRKRILKAAEAGRKNLASGLATLLDARGEPDSEAKARFAVFSCAAILQSALIVEFSGDHAERALNDEQLEGQLKAMLIDYLT